MRALQFWILIFASTFVSGLMIKQIFLTRELNQQQRALVDSQDVVTQGAAYENAWKQLAMRVFKESRQDPTLAAVLKKENVEVRENPDAGPGASPTAPIPSATSKAPVAPPHPATP